MESAHRKYILDNLGKKPIWEIAQDLHIKEKKVRVFLREEGRLQNSTAQTDETPAAQPAVFRIPTLIILLALAALGFLIYSNTLRSSFQFDDVPAIVDDYFIRDIRDVGAIWDAFNTRFLVGYSLALNYAIGKLDILGYHLFNIGVHILNSLLVFFLVTLSFKTPAMKDSLLVPQRSLVAFFAALVFVAHPIQTQAVTYIWQRAASVATFFYLISLVLYVKARLKSSFFYYLAALVSTVLAMFTKEITFTLPIVIAGYEFFFFRPLKGKFLRKALLIIPFLATLVIIPLTLTRASKITLNLMRPHISAPSGDAASLKVTDVTRFMPEEQVPRKQYMITELNVMRTYLRLLLFPINQNLDYDYPWARSLTEPKTFLSLSLIVLILACGVMLFNKAPLVSFGIFWFFLTASLEAVIPQQDFIFEHRLYLPIVGFCVVLASVLFYLFGKKRLAFALTLSLIIVAAFSVSTYKRNFVWRDPITLWSDVIAKSPLKARSYNIRGINYKDKGDFDRALADYNKATELNPDYAEPYSNRASIYALRKEFDKSIEDFTRMIELKPENSEVYANRGLAYNMRGELDKAVSDFDKAIELDPINVRAYFNRGVAYKDKGDIDKAISDWTKAIELNPFYAEAYNNRAAAYFFKKEYDKSRQDLRRAEGLGRKNAKLLELLDSEAGKNPQAGATCV
ncbi:MAG: tetratricopeptide repeat protein [Candidatus Omnitrophica bacterium]|nr:tetratricopeptide repeat protein [Candidatus Omnitrophota bacterium]